MARVGNPLREYGRINGDDWAKKNQPTRANEGYKDGIFLAGVQDSPKCSTKGVLCEAWEVWPL